jgi:hypothetical protein
MKSHSNSRERKILDENALVEILISFLKAEQFKVFLEVPNMGQSTDIVACKNRWLTFIEAKLHNWRRGIEQCVAHELIADFICLAVATVSISDDLKNIITTKGYGLIHCDPYSGICSYVIKPRQNKKIWLPQRNVLLKNLRSIENED